MKVTAKFKRVKYTEKEKGEKKKKAEDKEQDTLFK